jgi:hypothetical protein
VIIGELRVCTSIAPSNRTSLALPHITVVIYSLPTTRTLRLIENQIARKLGITMRLPVALRAVAQIEPGTLLAVVVMLAARILQRPTTSHVTGVFHVNALPR